MIYFHAPSPSLMTKISGAASAAAIAIRRQWMPNKKAAHMAPLLDLLIFIVVPANAGTYMPRPLLWHRG
jgi:hypothetical protein